MSENNLRKWRRILGADQNDGTGMSLGAQDLRIDKTLEALYDSDRPRWPRWFLSQCEPLARRYPQLLSQYRGAGNAARCAQTPRSDTNAHGKEMLENVEADVHLVATLSDAQPRDPRKNKRHSTDGSAQSSG